VSSSPGSPACRAFRTLPIVDVSDLASPEPVRRRQAAEALGRATRDAGFLYIVGHGVPPALGARLVEQAAAFFALPLERKLALYIGRSANHRGYVPAGEEVFYGGGVDLKEAFDLAMDLPADDPAVRAGTPMLGPNVWPDLPGFKDAVQDYYQAVFALGRRLLRGFALALGLREETFDAHVTRPPSQLRLVHYPYDAHADAGGGAGIAPHTDYECFTILLPTAPGLEVMNDEGAWVDAPPRHGALLVNVGDLLEIWTNGAFVATSHRVRPVREERFSFPLFFCCDYHTEVAPLPAFVGRDQPARYQAVRAGEHLYAQTIQSFKYMQARLAAGDVALPSGARPLSSFGQAARHREGHDG
jgi:isopenicillin N synthase-like dioxygenase